MATELSITRMDMLPTRESGKPNNSMVKELFIMIGRSLIKILTIGILITSKTPGSNTRAILKKIKRRDKGHIFWQMTIGSLGNLKMTRPMVKEPT